MYGRAFFGARMFGPRYWGDGGSGAPVIPPVVITETPSGGWARAFRDESDSQREARIKAERVKLGILPPNLQKPAALEAAGATIEVGPLLLPTPDPGLAMDLAGLYAGAYLDQEIRRHFELQDDDDAAVLLLAIGATLH